MQRERKDQPMTFEAALPPPLWWWVVVRLVVVVATAAAAAAAAAAAVVVVVVVVLLSTSNATQIYWVVVLLVVLAPPVLQVLLPVPLALLVLLVPYFCAGGSYDGLPDQEHAANRCGDKPSHLRSIVTWVGVTVQLQTSPWLWRSAV